ncbi:MAG: hypothetical protein OEY34_00170 [Cyclobacteriaceae bacterium]|nr:hypothetical protein [Cyclobacteriaceae bacterium]
MKFTNPEEFFIKINQTYHLLLSGPLIIFVLLFLEKGESDWRIRIGGEYLKLFTVITPVLAILLLVYAIVVTRKSNRNIDSTLNLKDKLIQFNSHFKTEQFLFFLSGIVSMGGLYFTGSKFCIMSYLLVLFAASILRPSTDRLKKSLRLSKIQHEILLKKLSFDSEQ